jgi:hypothetical protein
MAAETSKKRSGRVGQVRCQSCFERFRPAPGVEKATCPAWNVAVKDVRVYYLTPPMLMLGGLVFIAVNRSLVL